MRLKGDIAGSNYLTNLSNILNIRGQRQNLALSKFQLEQAKREEERRGGSGGSGSGASSTPVGETDAQRRAREKREADKRRQMAAAGASAIYSQSNSVAGGLPGITG